MVVESLDHWWPLQLNYEALQLSVQQVMVKRGLGAPNGLTPSEHVNWATSMEFDHKKFRIRLVI